MNSFQTKKEDIHYRRNYGNNGPICSKPTDVISQADYCSTNVPAMVTCKNCIKRFPSIGITAGKVRKLTPKHLGRLSEDERQAQEAGTRIHAVRDLRELMADATPDLLMPEQAIKIFRSWLRDVAHDFRMRNELDEQATVERIIGKLEEK